MRVGCWRSRLDCILPLHLHCRMLHQQPTDGQARRGESFTSHLALSLQACEVVKGFFGVPLDGFEASERGRFVLPVIFHRMSFLTRQLSNFLLDSYREMFYAELLH